MPENPTSPEPDDSLDASAPFWDAPDRREVPDRRQFGPYRILGILGSGGMGVVYRAEQEHPRRTVALKVIRAPAVAPHLLRRFEQEAQVLGRLEHPGIAQIFEAGQTETEHGPLPYFAMEYIEGRAITDYANHEHLNTRDRLGLMAKVCDAVEHAHQKGVIHRDIKPSNVLVDLFGQPKILDFGVAQATDGDVQVTTLHTDVGQLVGTLPYMSPEQVAGDPADLDTRSDVYALGIMMYELLTGERPFQLERKSIAEAARVIRETEPAPASMLNRYLRGDLQTIISKAMEKEKDRRYSSASEMALDIRRHLDDEPITARPPSALYQFRKFARRNKAVVGGVTAVFVALVLGVIGTGYGLIQATEQRDAAHAEQARARKAEKVADSRRAEAEEARDQLQLQIQTTDAVNAFLQTMLSSVEPAVARGRELTMREVLETAATRVENAPDQHPEVEAAVRSTLGNTYMNLGLYDQAGPHLRRALDLRAELSPEDHPDTAKKLQDLAVFDAARGRYAEAEELNRRALGIRQRVHGLEHPDIAESLNAIGENLRLQGRFDEAEAHFRQALEMRRKLLEPNHEDVGKSLNSLAVTLRARGELAEARTFMTEALDIFVQAIGADHPTVAAIRSNLAQILQEAGDYAGTETMMRQALATRRAVLAPDHPLLANTLSNLGNIVRKRGDLEEAGSLLREALDIMKAKHGDDHPSVAAAMNNLAGLLKNTGEYAEARVLYERTLNILRERLGPEHPHVAATLNNIAVTYTDEQNYQPAEPLLREALALWTKIHGDEHPQVARALGHLGVVLRAAGRYEEAEEAHRRSLAMRIKLLGESHPDVASTQTALAYLLVDRQRSSEAEPLLRSALRIRLEALPEGHYLTALTRNLLGAGLTDLQQLEEAHALLVESQPILVKAYGADSPEAEEAAERLERLCKIMGTPDCLSQQ